MAWLVSPTPPVTGSKKVWWRANPAEAILQRRLRMGERNLSYRLSPVSRMMSGQIEQTVDDVAIVLRSPSSPAWMNRPTP